MMGQQTTDQPHANAALGSEPVRTIGRDELKAKLDRGDDFKLIMLIALATLPLLLLLRDARRRPAPVAASATAAADD